MEIYRLARRLDYDRTLAAGAAGAPASLYALIAFHAELAAIRAKVTDPITFEIRLLWWKEAIQGFKTVQVKKHPILEALFEGYKRNELDEELLTLMVENRFREFQEAAPNFKVFIEERRFWLEAVYMNSYLALAGDEREGDRDIFLGLDLLEVLKNDAFYKTKTLVPFKGAPEPALIEALLGAKAGHSYFKGLQALGEWHYRRLKKANFNPEALKGPAQHPGKILKIWAAKWA